MSLRNVLNMVARILAPVSELTNTASFTARVIRVFFPCDLYPPQQVALNVLGQRLPPPASFTEVGTVATMAFSRLTRGTRDDCCTTGSWKNMRTLLYRHYSHCVGFDIPHVPFYYVYWYRDFVDIPSIRSMNAFARVLFFAVQMLFFAMAQDQGLRLVGTRVQLGPCWGWKLTHCQTGHRSTCHSIIGGYTQMGGMPALFSASVL